MIIRVRSSVGTWRITLPDDVQLTFADVKSAIVKQQNVPRDSLRLSRDATDEGEYKNDGTLLCDADVGHGSLIFLLGRHEKQIVSQSYVGEGGVIVGAGTKIVAAPEDKCSLDDSSAKSAVSGSANSSPPITLPRDLLPSEQGAFVWSPPSPEVRAPIAARNMTLLGGGDDSDDDYEGRVRSNRRIPLPTQQQTTYEEPSNDIDDAAAADADTIAAALAAGVPSHEIEAMMRSIHDASSTSRRREQENSARDIIAQTDALVAMMRRGNGAAAAKPEEMSPSEGVGNDEEEALLQAAILESMQLRSEDEATCSSSKRTNTSSRDATLPKSSDATSSLYKPIEQQKTNELKTSTAPHTVSRMSGQSVRKSVPLIPADAPPPFRPPRSTAVVAPPKLSSNSHKRSNASLERKSSKEVALEGVTGVSLNRTARHSSSSSSSRRSERVSQHRDRVAMKKQEEEGATHLRNAKPKQAKPSNEDTRGLTRRQPISNASAAAIYDEDEELKLAIALSMKDAELLNEKSGNSSASHKSSPRRKPTHPDYSMNSHYRMDESDVEDSDVAAAIALSIAEEADVKARAVADNPPNVYYDEEDEMLARAMSEVWNDEDR